MNNTMLVEIFDTRSDLQDLGIDYEGQILMTLKFTYEFHGIGTRMISNIDICTML